MTTSALVPAVLPFAIDGHPFLIDPDYERATVQVIRQQSDTSTEPGEQSLSPLGLWRRSQESWHHGAGQDFLDGRDEQAADPHRFRSSKGIDPWTRGQVSLLHPTIKTWASANTNLHLAVAQDTSGIFWLYLADGNELYFSGLPYSSITSLAAQQGTGWSATNATIAAEDTFFKLTATSAAAVSVTSPTGTNGFPVEVGRRYGFSVGSLYLSGGAAKTPRINVTWYTAAGATISSSSPVNASGSDGSGVGVITNETAPATAAFASITIGWTTNWANGEVHELYVISFGPYDATSTIGAPDGWQSAGIQAGEAAQPIQSIASNGSHVWGALGTSGLHRAVAGTSGFATANVPAAPGSGQISLVGYANGFLLAAGSAGVSATRRNTLWRVDDPLGTPALTVIKTHPNTNFAWEGIASGRSVVYAWGNSGGNGEIYKVPFDPATGTLTTAASSASMLPDGESIHALYFYAGGIILGTGKGVRLGQADGAGNIDYGPLVETDWPVRCLEPQGRFCWFGWTKYDASNSGLGRVDLGYYTDTLTPAWASDLMTADTSTGDTVSAVTFAPYGYTAAQRPPVVAFTVAGEGLYVEDPTSRVLFGKLETGTIRFSTSEPKTTRSLDIRHHALPDGAEIGVEQQRDDTGTWTLVGASSTDGSFGPATPISTGSLSVEALEYQFTLTRAVAAVGLDFSQSPEVTRWTAKVLPTPSTIDETFTVKIHMKASVTTTAGDGQPYHIDIPTEVDHLKGLERSRDIVEMQLGDETHDVYVASSQFTGIDWHSPKREFAEGFYLLTCQTVRG